jgi:hypothetical protein
MLEQLVSQCQAVLSALWIASSVAFFALVGIWRAWATTKYLREALGREMRSNSSEQRRLIGLLYSRSNQMQRELLTSFLRAPTPTLADLVSSTERELRVRESGLHSGPPMTAGSDERTSELRTQDFFPPSPDSPTAPRSKR